MKTKVCFSVPGQKGGTERLVLRCLSVPGQDVLSRDRKAGQNVWDRRAGTERPGTRRTGITPNIRISKNTKFENLT